MDKIAQDIQKWNEDFHALEEECKRGFYDMRRPVLQARVENLKNRIEDIMRRIGEEVEAEIRALDAETKIWVQSQTLCGTEPFWI